ncbi:site-specific integrase [Deinococcus soli (ex Cha et al. 2016)]|uniref:Integrase n=2 Tax=Deinococcus soli (ex Cha et al. 2016) TaxID=1309411 RepID=A0AAE3XFK7_9DEIO|nr:site-specific integrase [Deinococcus soli (ex Cha et al. 2016)]MDR6219205.1 integrase [Deinococcus soli (ex Cha et al. 2016)]MDR6329454.1 integrase [Deinococcus soli (ex Cha et al. 2016)]MDR6752114.1 integrase [Deinococcus soli (ex Cha et al. 2016)]
MTSTRKTKGRGNGQGTVWKDGDGYRWQVTLGYRTDGSRITRSGRATTKKAAHDAMSKAQADYSRGLIGAPEKVTVAEYAERWKNRQLEVSPRTAKRYGEELDYALEHIGSMRLQDVRPHHLKDLMVRLSRREMRRGNTMSTRTQAHVLTRLRSVFREAVTDQIIYVNPLEGVKRVKAPRHESAGEPLDFDQAARLHTVGTALHAAGMCRLWPAVFTAVSVGLRRGEVMGLTWDDVDLERSVLRIRQARVMGVSGIETGSPKTINSRRDVHLPPSLITVLRDHQLAQAVARREAGTAWTNTGAVFATALGDWTHPDNLKRALESVVLWSDPARLDGDVWRGVPRVKRQALVAAVQGGQKLPDISPHDLRHTYATLALRRGVPAEVVSKVLGHARVSITLDVYRHVLDNERRATVVDLFDTVPPAPPAASFALN